MQVERRTGKVRQPMTDILPLCYTTNNDVEGETYRSLQDLDTVVRQYMQ